jgi:hypothetical protein
VTCSICRYYLRMLPFFFRPVAGRAILITLYLGLFFCGRRPYLERCYGDQSRYQRIRPYRPQRTS